MDFYQYYLQRLENASDPEAIVKQSAEVTTKLIDEAPTIVGLEAGVGLLTAIHNYRNSEGIELAPVFEQVELAINSALYGLRTDLELSDNIWSEQHNDPGVEADVCPIPDAPSCEPAQTDEPEEVEHTCGAHRHYPDYEHWNSWSDAEWINFEGYKKKVLAAASCSLATMGFVTNTLAAVQQNMHCLPIERRVEVAVWCSEVVDNFYEKLESELFEICRDNLYSREGRAVQRRMMTTESTQSETVTN